MSERGHRFTAPTLEGLDGTSFPFPFHELPVEIVETIFGIASYEDIERRGQNLTRLSIIRVCRSWREVALALPCLWTTIAFPSEANISDRPAIVAQDLLYGEKYGLDIYMDPFLHNSTGLTATFRTYVELTLERRLSWRSIYVDSLPRGTVPLIVQTLKTDTFPRLVRVDVDCSTMGGVYDVGLLPSILCKGADELHSLRLKFVELWPVMFRATLRFLELDDCVLPRLSTFLNALKALTSLGSLSITACLPYADFHDLDRMQSCTPVTLPSLRVLSLGVYEDEHDSCFVDKYLECPLLDHLRLWMIVKACARCRQRSSIEWYRFTRLPRAIARKAWPITTLDLGGIHCDFSDISRSMPYVRRLRIQMAFHAVDISNSSRSSHNGSYTVFPSLAELAVWRADDVVTLERALGDPDNPFLALQRVYAPRGPILPSSADLQFRADSDVARQKLEAAFQVLDRQPSWVLKS